MFDEKKCITETQLKLMGNISRKTFYWKKESTYGIIEVEKSTYGVFEVEKIDE